MNSEDKEMTEKNSGALSDVIAVNYLTPSNSVFSKQGDFLTLTATLPDENGKTEEKHYNRIFLHRAFPFDMPYKYISVLDADSAEIGIIADIDGMGKEYSMLLREELDRKYYCPKIKQIISSKEKFGFTYMKVLTDDGECDLTLRDAYSSLHKVGETRIFVTDIDGNRYEIPDIEKLDRNSYKKIELYL